MQIGAVSNFRNVNTQAFTARKNKKSKEQEFVQDKWHTMDEMKANESHQRKVAKALRDYALTGAIGLATIGGAASCGEDIVVNHEHKFNLCCPVDTANHGGTTYIKEYLPGQTVYQKDTIFNTKTDTIFKDRVDTLIIEKPGKSDTIYIPKVDTIINNIHDTIIVEKPIYVPPDTVYVVPNFESEVVDTLNKDLCDLGIDCDEGLPVQMVFNDEWNVTNNALMLNGKLCSPDRIVYDNTITDWYDEKEYTRAELSIAKGKGLVVQLKRATVDGAKPNSELEWKLYNTFVLQNVGGKLIKLQLDGNNLKKYGTITRGDKEFSVFNNNDLPNGEVETWRLSDWKVKRHDLTLDQLYNNYLEQKEQHENSD